MIVCKQCGFHNEEGDTFCGSCGSFLEWVGEKIGGEEEPEPEPVVVEEDDKKGIFTRIKEKITDVAEGDAETGVTEHPDADRALTADELAPEKPVVAAAAAAAVASTRAPPAGGAAAEGAPAATGSSLPPPPGGGLAPPGGGTATLPPPADTPEAAAAREKAKAEADAQAKKAAEEEAKREAEEEAKRKEDEARRRAALLVAKPKEVEPEQKAAVTPQKDAGKKKKGKGADEAADAEAAAKAAATTATIESRTPGAQKPGQQQKKTTKQKEPPTRVIKPGDLVCGECGEGNDPGRKFCRRCGVSLVEATVAKKPGFFKRLFTRKPKEAVAAGTRPGGRGGRGGKAGEKGRLAKGKILGVFTSVGQLLTVLAVLGIGVGLALPNVRTGAFNFFNSSVKKVRNIVSPTYERVSPVPEDSQASSNPGDAFKVVDDNILTHWSPDPADPTPFVQVKFAVPTSLDILFVYSGIQDEEKDFAANPRPQSLFVTMLDAENQEVGTKQVTLANKPEAQKFDLSGKNVTSVRVDVQSCFPDPAIKQCAIAELEFQKKDT